MAKFGGFTEKQMQVVAQKMGFKGPMHKFNEFLAASPGKAAELQRFSDRARNIVENPVDMAKGGVVKKPKEEPKKEPKEEIQPNLALQKTKDILKNPMDDITKAKTDKIDLKKKELIDKDSGDAGEAKTIKKKPDELKATQADSAKKTKANEYKAKLVSDDIEDVVDETPTIQGEVSDEAQVDAATALPSSDATVAGQLEKLMSQFADGKAPPWAAGAMRMAQTVMAQRGLGSSSMAGAAITQAAMESALQIAVQDAQTFSAFEMQNLNNRQQARLVNAQAFLQMDLANLDIANQTNLFKAQARIQGLFTDQAAANAAKQFNATSQNQTDQFFAQLKTQVSQFNAAQKNGMKMFNTEQSTAIKMFNTEQINQRDQFNANNRLIIDQANAKWRQTIATVNNSQTNENNRLNAQLATGLTTQAYNNLWQQQRDLMAFAFAAAENQNQRAHEVVLQKMGGDAARDFAQGQATGNLLGKIFDVGMSIDWSKVF